MYLENPKTRAKFEVLIFSLQCPPNHEYKIRKCQIVFAWHLKQIPSIVKNGAYKSSYHTKNGLQGILGSQSTRFVLELKRSNIVNTIMWSNIAFDSINPQVSAVCESSVHFLYLISINKIVFF